MTNRVRLDNVDHAELTVAAGHARAFGDAVNQVLVLPSEFEQVQREYPILFRRDEAESFYAVALLGLDLDENLFLADEGWQARYVPMVQQRGPFLLGPPADGGGEPVVHVDLDDPRVGAAGGEPLFLRHGGATPYLQRVTGVLHALRRDAETAGPFFAALQACDLIQAVSLDIKLDDGKSYVVPNVFTVAQDRLAALGGAPLDRLHRSGFLRPAIMAATSIANVSRLIELKNTREAAR